MKGWLDDVPAEIQKAEQVDNYLSFSGALSSFIKSGGCGLSFKMEAKSQDMLKFLKYTMNF